MADKPDQWLGWLESKHTVRKFVLVCVVVAVLFVLLIWAFGGPVSDWRGHSGGLRLDRHPGASTSGLIPSVRVGSR
jgi:hypothetical protein